MENKTEEQKKEENPMMVIQNSNAMAIAKTNERSLEIGELVQALAKAQGQMENAKKDASNPFFKSSYADLSSVINVAKKPLSENDLAISQLVNPSKDYVIVTTILMHKSGQFLTSTISLTPVKSDPQGFGSAITYARRYAYQAIIGLSAEDDDGNAASKVGANPKQSTPAVTPAATASTTKPASDAQIKMLVKMLETKGESVDKVIAYFKIKTLSELTSSQASGMISKLLSRTAPKTAESGPKKEEDTTGGVKEADDKNTEDVTPAENLKEDEWLESDKPYSKPEAEEKVDMEEIDKAIP